MPQSKRLQILKSFKAGQVKVLVATDVAARGIDVDDLAMVINYDLPVEAENYVHRIGRTARAGKSGKAYTFCSEQDVYNLPAIERYIEMQIPAQVAYDDQMEDDKSAGVYIKTENWHGDDDFDNHGGYRKNSKSNSHNKGGNRHYDKKDSHKDYDKAGGKKYGDSYSKNKNANRGKNKNSKKPYISPEKLAGMSYEERMKFYKERYGGSSVQPQGSAKNNSKKYKNNSAKKNNYSSKSSKPVEKKITSNVQKKPEKKSFFDKLKSLFGKRK